MIQTRPKIFVTNDDGIHSPGLRAAIEAVMELGEILVVAPSTQQTAMGRSFTGNLDATLIPIDYVINGQHIEAFHCECSPALAVSHGLNVLCERRKPDLIISGINYGENVGTNVTISGTIGAAYEGASQGIPALAVSLQTDSDSYFHHTDQDWSAAAHFSKVFAGILLSRSLPFDVDVLKVDVPENASAETPWRLTRLSRQVYVTSAIEHPSRESKIWDAKITVSIDQAALEPDSDTYALRIDQVVAVTPLSLDLTSRTDFQSLYNTLR
jgi:5'-nucleotidase